MHGWALSADSSWVAWVEEAQQEQAQAPSMNQQIETAFNGVFKDAAAFDKQINLLFISTGTEERSPKETVEALKTHGIKHIVFHESQGTAHEWLTWRRALNDFAPRIFK